MIKTKEKDWENHLVKQFQEWGWTKLDTIFRQNNHEVIDKNILGKQLQSLNPELRTEAREKIISDLVNFSSSYEKITTNNYEFYYSLIKGIDYFDQFSQSYKKVQLIDRNREKNDFSFVQQFKVENLAGEEFVIFDLVLFINGIPLTIIEVKNWSDDDKNLLEKQQNSLAQIKGYEKTVPHIFNYLNFATASLSPSTFYYGVCGKDNQNYFLWKEREKNILFTPQNFFDICQNFTLYNKEKEKFIIRYYQLEAIREINLAEPLAGVVQHATGKRKIFFDGMFY